MKKILHEFQSALEEKNIDDAFLRISYSSILVMPFLMIFLLFLLPIGASIWMPAHLLITETDHQEFTFFYNYYAYPAMLFIFFIFILFLVIKISIAKQWGSVIREIGFHKALIFFAVFIILMIASTFVNGFTDFAIHGEPYRNESLFSYIAYIWVFFISGFCVRSLFQKKFLVNILLISSLAVGTYSIINSIVYGSLGPYRSIKVQTGIYYNSNHYGYYLSMVIALAAALAVAEKNRTRRSFYLIIFCFNAGILQFNRTLGAWVACLFALVFQIIIRFIVDKKRSGYAIFELVLYLAITGIIGLYDNYMILSILSLFIDIKRVSVDPMHSDDAGSARWRLWKITAGKIVQRPLLGYGVEGLYYDLGTKAHGWRTHCEYLQYASFFGIPAAIVYVTGCVQVFMNGYRKRSSIDGVTLACLVAAFSYLVSASFGNSWFYTTPYFFVLLGMGYSINAECN